MKKLVRYGSRFLLFTIILVTIVLMTTAGYHHLALTLTSDQSKPAGTLVELDGRQIHVYAEGETNNGPTLVFLAGSGTVAPMYDFKPLYSLFLDQYRIAVVEKAGYGYSDIYDVSRDIDVLLQEVRQALHLAGERGPYVLLPHSMSGLEAVYWAQQYPDEILAIVGLDMSTPESYEFMDVSKVRRQMFLARVSTALGVHRIPGLYPLHTATLDEAEIEQQKRLMFRNAMNIDHRLEAEAVFDNALKVKSGQPLTTQLLMFTSTGDEMGDYWLLCQENFAEANGGQLIYLDAGHYIHHEQADKIVADTKEFLRKVIDL